ncbi:L-threonylcarbamoyladenylate synthase [Aquirufa rosea]|uniref:L-threonylcarbamoyladenylate synthase n=1 Tax=Aquirufa rosea TaxID=2509241 RepID=A0A4Q1C2V9_9BACT|nr:L-threonylcarbamoyladenylate synthase [Aquirufa rosea]RXK52499.1 threonylcarbamoyl-AMP synthase [Aquirufa rosea]
MIQSIYDEAIKSLKSSGVILYPSDTIWGLGCDARMDGAIEKLFNIKQRPENKGLILLISKIEQLNEYVEQVPDIAWDLVDFAEDPLTVIYPKGKNVSQHVLGPEGSIAIRLVKDDFCKGLVYRYQRAIVSTSANISGEDSPERFEDISIKIKEGVDYILQNPNPSKVKAKASKIVKLGLNGDYSMIRK